MRDLEVRERLGELALREKLEQVDVRRMCSVAVHSGAAKECSRY